MKKILAFLMSLALCAGLAAPAAAAGFSDVPPDSPFAQAIDWAVEKDITQGKAPGVFAPGEPCSKGQILTFLWRSRRRPSPFPFTEYPYSDEVPDAYRTAAIWAYERSIVDACMISDYLFGNKSNPMRQLTDKTQTRPGDIIVFRNSRGEVGHVAVVASTVYYVKSYPCISTHDGNMGGVVTWSFDQLGPIRVDAETNSIIYTRYPE